MHCNIHNYCMYLSSLSLLDTFGFRLCCVADDALSLHRFHWVSAIDTGQDCVMDEGSQQRSDLLAITPDLCLHWYSVCEGGGAREGEEMKIEQLATLSKDDLLSELKKLKFCKLIEKYISF